MIWSSVSFAERLLQHAPCPMERYRHGDGRYSQGHGDLWIAQAFEESQRKDFRRALREFSQSLPQNFAEITFIRTKTTPGRQMLHIHSGRLTAGTHQIESRMNRRPPQVIFGAINALYSVNAGASCA
jgi:hypothetical protein